MEAASVISWKPLGEMLIERGLLTVEALDSALEEQERTGKRLGGILAKRRLVSGPVLTMLLAEQAGVELERQEGFGSGLFAAIAQRTHTAGPPASPVAPRARPRLEPVALHAPAPAPPSEIPIDEAALLRLELESERGIREQLERELDELRAQLEAARRPRRSRSKPAAARKAAASQPGKPARST